METDSTATASHAVAAPTGSSSSSGGSIALPAAAAAAAAAADEGGSESAAQCRAFGACWSLSKAYDYIRAAGCDTNLSPPAHIAAGAGLNPGDLTVLGARAALAQGRQSGVAVQASKKRNADGTRLQLVGWVVL